MGFDTIEINLVCFISWLVILAILGLDGQSNIQNFCFSVKFVNPGETKPTSWSAISLISFNFGQSKIRHLNWSELLMVTVTLD